MDATCQGMVGMVRGERHSLKVRENDNLFAFERSHKMSRKLDLIPIIFSWHWSSWWKLLSIIFQSCNLKLVWEWSCTFSFSFFSLFSNIYLMLKMWEVFSAFHTLGFFFRIGRILHVKSNCTTSCFGVCKKINPPHYIKGLSLYQFIYTVCDLLIAHWINGWKEWPI